MKGYCTRIKIKLLVSILYTAEELIGDSSESNPRFGQRQMVRFRGVSDYRGIN